MFLALLNMFKHRGHFLNSGLGENGGENNINNAYLELTNLLSEFTQYNLNEQSMVKK